MQDQRLTLVEPQMIFKEQFLQMAAEFLSAGEFYAHHETASQDFTAFLARLQDEVEGVNLPPGFVPMQTYWLLNDEKLILGESRLRRWLTPALEIEGGHIGYAIRPSARRLGYGARILSLTLEKARARGLQRVLVTCDEDNHGSRRIIEKNGGMLSGRAISTRSGKPVLQFWIDLQFKEDG